MNMQEELRLATHAYAISPDKRGALSFAAFNVSYLEMNNWVASKDQALDMPLELDAVRVEKYTDETISGKDWDVVMASSRPWKLPSELVKKPDLPQLCFLLTRAAEGDTNDQQWCIYAIENGFFGDSLISLLAEGEPESMLTLAETLIKALNKGKSEKYMKLTDMPQWICPVVDEMFAWCRVTVLVADRYGKFRIEPAEFDSTFHPDAVLSKQNIRACVLACRKNPKWQVLISQFANNIEPFTKLEKELNALANAPAPAHGTTEEVQSLTATIQRATTEIDTYFQQLPGDNVTECLEDPMSTILEKTQSLLSTSSKAITEDARAAFSSAVTEYIKSIDPDKTNETLQDLLTVADKHIADHHTKAQCAKLNRVASEWSGNLTQLGALTTALADAKGSALPDDIAEQCVDLLPFVKRAAIQDFEGMDAHWDKVKVILNDITGFEAVVRRWNARMFKPDALGPVPAVRKFIDVGTAGLDLKKAFQDAHSAIARSADLSDQICAVEAYFGKLRDYQKSSMPVEDKKKQLEEDGKVLTENQEKMFADEAEAYDHAVVQIVQDYYFQI